MKDVLLVPKGVTQVEHLIPARKVLGGVADGECTTADIPPAGQLVGRCACGLYRLVRIPDVVPEDIERRK